MKKLCLVLLSVIVLPIALLAQQSGDFRSAVNGGNWGTAATWETFNGTSWVAATGAPGSTNNVTIRNGFDVILDASGKNCKNLTIEAGATFKTGVALPTSSIRYVRINGDSLLVNGTFGDATTGDAIAVENANNGGTLLITGTGTFAPSRLRVYSGASGTTTIFGINAKFMYTGSTGTGGVALYPQTDKNTFVVNAGDTVTFVDYASVAVGSSVSTASGQSVTYVVNGRMDLSQPNSTFNIKTSGSGNVGTLIVGANGSLSVGKDLLTSLASDVGSSIITDSGSTSVGGTFYINTATTAHFAGSSTIQGSGNVEVDSNAILIVDNPNGVDGVLQNSGTKTFSNSVNFVFSGTAAQTMGTLMPDSAASLKISNTAGVTLSSNITASTITVDSNTTLATAAGDTLTVTSKGNIKGTLINRSSIRTSDTLTFYDGSKYTHAVNGAAIPIGQWNSGSTCELTGITGNAPSNGNQNFYNVVWNSPGQSSSLNLGWNGNTIGGDITIVSTGSGRWQLCAPSTGNSATVTINGNITMSNGQFTAQGTSNGNTTVIINTLGNVNVTGGNFSVARGSQGGTGTTTWNLYGDFSMSNATTQNSNSAGAKFVFKKQGTQNLTLGAGNTLTAFPIEVDSGTTLNPGSSVLLGSGIFTLQAGAGLMIQHTTGVDSLLKNTGTITLSKQANYIYNGSVKQVTGMLLPDTVGTLTVSTSDTLSLSDSLAASKIVVSTGSTLNVNQNLKTVTMDVSGTVLAADTLMVSDTATFNSGSVYNHAMNGGTIPTGKWNAGSTLMLTGITGNAPSNGNQNFYNVVWNCPNQSSNLNLGWKGNTIGGDITVINTGASRWQLCAPTAGDTAIVTIMGSVTVSGTAQLSSNGTSNANTVIVIDQMGDVNVTGGNFSVSRGSQGSGSGSTRWRLYGDFKMSNATTQNSNATNAWFVFAKQGTQKLLLGNGNTITALPIEVSSGTTLDLDTSVVAGNGRFMADSGAVIITRHPSGLGGNVTSSGTISFNPKTDFVYGGKVAQVTGALLPDTLYNLTIDDSSGVVLSKPTRINGTLTLKAGLFNNAIAFVLGPNGTIVYAGGTLLIPVNLAVVTIAEARKDDNHDFIPDHLNDTLKVFGVVTSPNMGSTYTSYYVQDATAGINVYKGGTAMSFAIGDSVFVIGKVLQNKGLTEISPLVADSIHFGILKHNAVVPAPRHLTLHQYVSDAESFEGLLVEVDSLFKVSGTWGSGATISLTNVAQTDTAVMYLNANTGVGSEAEPEYPINLVGIASQYSSSASVYNDGYEIIPRDTSDIKHIVIVGVNNLLSNIPKDFYISQNYPNPFNPSTTINFGLPKDADVQITVYNILGQKVTVLVDEKMKAGNHQIVFNAARLASGAYIYVMRAGDKIFKEKMLLLK